MRLGIDGSSIRGGGGVTHLLELLNAARSLDTGVSQVTVWAGRRTLDQLPTDPWINPVYDSELDHSLLSRARWQRARLDEQARRHADLLFVPSGTYFGSFWPYVTMSHNLLPFEPEERRRYGISKQGVRLAMLARSQSRTFRRADGVIFLNDYARQAVEKRTGPLVAKTAVIPHGIAGRFFHEPRQQRDLASYSPQRPFRWLYISTVNLYKHQWHVAEAAAALRNEGYPVELDLVGSAYRPALARLEQTLLRVDPERAFIRYHGLVDYADLDEFYARADAFVFASSCENMPNILLEAMAAALPIGSSNRGPMPLILGPAGCYFDPEQPVQIAQVMKQLMMDARLRKSLATAAYRRARGYDWTSTAQQTFAFFKDVAGAHEAGRDR